MQSLLWRQEIVKKQNIHHTEISNDELLKRKLEAQAGRETDYPWLYNNMGLHMNTIKGKTEKTLEVDCQDRDYDWFYGNLN